ncbi:hypothetical protein HAX54_030299 [Datura stramonium]|uniref:RRM domain-containing protein n=1 Tax=Datura stramonium TaxID=4076 RepID=A0ABS8SAU3_DATST|nr:hypothetical protein [Datura stramonium]
MSLHLGNLSSYIRREELERVFRRFGRCNVRVKDKFGFVDYDYPKNAEKALKTLRGKFICGEPIHLSWSNRQPRPLQKYARGVKPFEAVRRKHPATEVYVDHIDCDVGSNGRQGNSGERLSADFMNEACHENMKDYEEHRPFVDNIPGHGRGVVASLSEKNRWHEQVINPINENVLEDELDFDRYEPDKADGLKEQNILTHRDGSPSPSLRKPNQNAGMEQIEQITHNHSNDLKTQNACYNCVEAGHNMWKCTQGFKRLESRTSGRLRAGRETKLKMVKGMGDAIDSKNGHRLRGEPSPSARTTHRGGRNNHRENKRCWKEQGSIEKFHPKKARGPILPSNHSNNTVSRSQPSSRSVRSLSHSSSPSRSKSVSSVKDSSTSSSQFGSTTLHTRYKSFKCNSISRSSSPTSSSSMGKVQIDQKASFVDAGDPQSKGVLFEGEPLENSAARLDASELENLTIEVENQCEAAACEVQENVEDDYTRRRDATDIDRDSCQGKNSNTTGPDTCDLKKWSASPKILAETRELQNKEAEQTCSQNQNSGLTVSERLHATTLTSLSSEEVYRVLENYGLENQEKRENELPVETYFGCSRLWPWEIIYYRRLKKGLISIENYSRRLAQNKEFGIVDKFVRSSSGWGELNEENS